MTATTRRNFGLFGDYISFDMMKRGINTLLFPYTAVSMEDEMNHLCIGCEGIVCGEILDMYTALTAFLAKYASGRPLSSVRVVAGDGLFDVDMVKGMGFTNARFIQDQHHLLESGLQNAFGKVGYDLLKSHLVRLVQANSEIDFEVIADSARSLFAAD